MQEHSCPPPEAPFGSGDEATVGGRYRDGNPLLLATQTSVKCSEPVPLGFVPEDYTKTSFDDLLNIALKGKTELHEVCFEAYVDSDPGFVIRFKAAAFFEKLPPALPAVMS